MTVCRDCGYSAEESIVRIARIGCDDWFVRDQLGSIVGDQKELAEPGNARGPIPFAERSNELCDYLVAWSKVRRFDIACEDSLERLARVLAASPTPGHRRTDTFILAELNFFAPLVLGLDEFRTEPVIGAPRTVFIRICQLQQAQMKA